VIFFQIQAAYNLDYVSDLISFIYSRDNFYCIVVDKHRAAMTSALQMRLTNFDNIEIVDDCYVTWGGVSQVNSMLRGMSYMLGLGDRYRYYINLSDSDLPLWTSDRMKQFLADAEARSRLGFIAHWRPAVDFDSLTISDRTGVSEFSHRPDIVMSVDNSVADYFRDFAQSPIIAAALRPVLVCSEQPAVKTLQIRPLMPFEKTVRAQFFAQNPIYIGRQWLILHASLIRWILSNPAFITFYQTFATTFIPDEMLFQTFLLNGVKDHALISSDNYRFRGGEPTNVSDADISELAACQAAFARKLDIARSKQLLENARSLFEAEIREFSRTQSGTAPARTDRPRDDSPMPPVSRAAASPNSNIVAGQDRSRSDAMWLTRLADKYGTDKGTVHFFRHRYTLLYDLLFAPLRQSEITFVEIGLALGGPETAEGRVERRVDPPSIRMWLEYFSRATIVGYDITDFSHFEHPRFRFVRGDLGNEADYERLRAAASSFDIIVDDASHASPHQQLAFRNLFGHLAPGGIYVIEDLHWQSPVYEDQQRKVPKTAEFFITYFERGLYIENEILTREFMASIEDQVEVFSYFSDFGGASPDTKLAVLRKRGGGPPPTTSIAAVIQETAAGGSANCSTATGSCRSFDLFDTLLSRRCVTAGRIFEEVQRLCGIADFVRHRYDAERLCFEAGDYTLDSIYENLARALGLSEANANRIKSIELRIEAANFIPIRQHCAEFSEGDVVVSDMYLPRGFIEKTLERVCGIRTVPLYLSSHGKRSGRVWQEIRRRHHVQQHTGDDPITDEASARSAGLQTRLTTVAHRTAHETQLADLHFVALSEWIREVRLATWNADPLLRRAQLAQIEVNLPLLFFATAHLLQMAKARGWERILFSGRDCYLWEHLYHHINQAAPGGPPAFYFHSSRPVRARPSAGYLEYFNSLRNGAASVVADLCGTGWSLSRLIEQAGGPRTEIFLLHHLDVPSLLSAYERWGATSGTVPIHSMLHRPADRRDNDVVEDLNRAPYRLLKDVQGTGSGFRPVFTGQSYQGLAADLFDVHQETFFFACRKLRHVPDAELRAMIERPVREVFLLIYGGLRDLLDDLDPLFAVKRDEEPLIWSAFEHG
jgi:SAM-dependent methyltransferase